MSVVAPCPLKIQCVKSCTPSSNANKTKQHKKHIPIRQSHTSTLRPLLHKFALGPRQVYRVGKSRAIARAIGTRMGCKWTLIVAPQGSLQGLNREHRGAEARIGQVLLCYATWRDLLKHLHSSTVITASCPPVAHLCKACASTRRCALLEWMQSLHISAARGHAAGGVLDARRNKTSAAHQGHKPRKVAKQP